MHIVKGSTPDFENYEVYYVSPIRVPYRFMGFKVWEYNAKEDVLLEGVVEADDETGLVVTHVRKYGCYLFTNGKDEIAIDNTAKLLLLLPNVKTAFIQSGYLPKLVSFYDLKVRIRYKGAPAIKPVEQPEEVNA